MWGFNTNYNLMLQASLKIDAPLKNGRFFIHLELPLFIGLIIQNPDTTKDFKGIALYLNGITFPQYYSFTWPKILSPVKYALTYLNTLSWEGENLSFIYSPKTPQMDADLENIIWYNPFYDTSTALVNRYVSFRFFDGTLQTSSLTEPSLFFLSYGIKPFSKSTPAFLSQSKISPLIWGDLKNTSQPSFGGGLDLASGPIGGDTFQVRLNVDGHVFAAKAISGENVSYRVVAGPSFLLIPLGLYVAYINKSSYHPYGPFLSPLVHGRTESYYSGIKNKQGILIRVVPGIAKEIARKVDFSVDTELYPGAQGASGGPLVFSLKAQIRWHIKRGFLNFAYIHENISNLSQFLDHKNNDAFIEFDLQYYLISDLLRIEWRHVLSFNNTADLKTRFTLTGNF